jgi:nucleotide-binding universal stress UspA family protein
MFEKIVLAVDGSESSQAAFQAAAGFASKTGASVEVVHVFEHNVIYSKAGATPDLETPEEANQVVTGVVKQLRDNGVTAHGVVQKATTHDVAQVIMATAHAAAADLIVVGRRGLSTFSGMLLGSVSNKLIHLSKRPVMVAR